MSIRLRDYQSGDFRLLWAIDQRCFARGIAYSHRELAHYIGMAGALTTIAVNDAEAGDRDRTQEILGFVVAHKLPRGVGHVVTIDVVAEARRSGVGTLLMNECEARLQAAGCKAVYLEVAVDNDSALRFYKRHGYSVLKTIPRYYLGSLDALLMGKKLKTPGQSRQQ